jgi:hypothetical protein
VAVARCQEAHPGVLQRRLLCLLSDYLLVVDQLSADRPHRFDWVYHNRSSAVETAAATQAADLHQAFAGAEYLANQRQDRLDGRGHRRAF